MAGRGRSGTDRAGARAAQRGPGVARAARLLAAGAIAALLLLALAGCGSSEEGPPLALPKSATALPGSKASHVVVIVMENKAYVDVIGNRDAPYINGLARRYALAKNYFGVTHPSLPNYLALTGGGTFGVTNDYTKRHFAARNITDQLEDARISWKAYMEDMPSPCYLGASSDGYAKKHDPFLYFDHVRNDPGRCSKVVPYTRLAGDLRSGRLPTYSFITPNLCDDMHNCDVATGDRFLAGVVPSLLREIGPHGMLVLTWDEGRTNRSCCRYAAGGRIPTIIAGPDVRPGSRPSTPYDHYSTLRTIDESLGLPRLGKAACRCTPPLDAAFRRRPRIRATARASGAGGSGAPSG